MIRGLIVVAAIIPSLALAVPPPPGSADAKELSTFSATEKEWIAKQHDHMGRFCCSEGDFAFVTIRQHGNVLEARPKHPDPSRGIPDKWLPIEDDRRVDLKNQKNVPDVVAAWYYNEKIQCVILGGGY